MANSQGIAALLEAEREAQKIVQKARDYRASRLKDARTEAAKEIQAYQEQKEKEFQAYEASHSGDSSTAQTDLDQATKEQIETLKSQFQEHKDKVVGELLERLMQVEPELHKNYKANHLKAWA